MDPQNIAKLISLVADSTLRGSTSLETNSTLNRTLWNLARELGCKDEVVRILQDTSLQEMTEAMKNVGLEDV